MHFIALTIQKQALPSLHIICKYIDTHHFPMIYDTSFCRYYREVLPTRITPILIASQAPSSPLTNLSPLKDA